MGERDCPEQEEERPPETKRERRRRRLRLAGEWIDRALRAVGVFLGVRR